MGKKISELERIAKKVRGDALQMTTAAGSGHPGGSLSAADIVVALYFSKMRHYPKQPLNPERDKFVLSKGHACPILYAVLAEAGYFHSGELKSLRKAGSILQGHPDRVRTPGVEASTGSLGQGRALPAALRSATGSAGVRAGLIALWGAASRRRARFGRRL